MPAIDLDDLAQQLANARASQHQIDAKPLDGITSLEEAYKLQAMAAAAYPSKQIGYKVGATNEGSQKLLGCNTPLYGPMFEQELLQPGAELKLRDGVLGGEAEFAFICASDFPTDKSLSTADLAALIERCHIAVEIVGRRTIGKGLPSLNCAVADFGVHAAFILGNAIDNWESMDLATVEVKASTNGEETNSGTGAMVLGHPLNSLLWLHNELAKNGSGLKAGDWVTTGTCLGVIAAVTGPVEIEFSGCGNISYKLT